MVDLGNTEGICGTLQIITSAYDLAQADNRLMVEWLLNCKYKTPGSLRHALVQFLAGSLFRNEDVRYALAETLHSVSVHDAFDIIIIDCPPRLTTSEIQAFCASSHLLIPTIFDRTSSEAVHSLCEQVDILKTAGICPYLKCIGVIGTMWHGTHTVQMQTKKLIQRGLKESRFGVDVLEEDKFIPYSAKIVRNADDGIAYLAMPQWQDRLDIRSAIASAAEYVAEQMGVPHPTTFRQAAE